MNIEHSLRGHLKTLPDVDEEERYDAFGALVATIEDEARPWANHFDDSAAVDWLTGLECLRAMALSYRIKSVSGTLPDDDDTLEAILDRLPELVFNTPRMTVERTEESLTRVLNALLAVNEDWTAPPPDSTPALLSMRILEAVVSVVTGDVRTVYITTRPLRFTTLHSIRWRRDIPQIADLIRQIKTTGQIVNLLACDASIPDIHDECARYVGDAERSGNEYQPDDWAFHSQPMEVIVNFGKPITRTEWAKRLNMSLSSLARHRQSLVEGQHYIREGRLFRMREE